MSPGPRREPDVEPGIEELGATDALLDRLGRREPADSPDSDDPLADLLSVFTAHLDAEPVPVRRTVDALARAESAGSGVPGSAVPGAPVPGAALSGVPVLRPVPARPDVAADPGHPSTRPGDSFADPDDELGRPAAEHRPGLRALSRPVADDVPVGPARPARRGLRGRRHRPDVLPLPLDRPQRTGADARTVRFNPLAGAAAVLVLVLAASLFSGAVTRGASFNPITGIELVVQRLTGTEPVPKVTTGQVEAQLAVARGALTERDLARARAAVTQARRLATSLAPNDQDAFEPRIRSLEQQIEAAQTRKTGGTLEGGSAPGTGSPSPSTVPTLAFAAD